MRLWLVFVDANEYVRKTQMEKLWVVLIVITVDRIMMTNGVNLQGKNVEQSQKRDTDFG